MLARWCGMKIGDELDGPHRLVGLLDVKNIPPTPIVFTPDQDAFLRGP